MRRVVVSGMGLVTPLGIGLERNWSSLTAGESGVRAIQSFEVSDLPARIAAQVPRGDTASGGSKRAVVETGATIKVPLYLEVGEVIKIDTRTREYVERVR